MDELPIGRRVAYWRRRRRMSQQVFADRLGKSKSWVDKVERGVRRLDKFSLIHDIAEVLQVEPQLFTGREPERRPGEQVIGTLEIAEIRAALERYDQVNPCFQAAVEPDLDELRKSVEHAWLTYQHARGRTLARLLPDLLWQAQAADAVYGNDPHLAADSARLLGQVYQITSSTLRNLGEFELGWLAADRAVSVARRSGDELLTGVATFRVAMSLLAMGRVRPALEVNISVANQLAPAFNDPYEPRRLSVYGMLLLQGAMAAARIGDSATTEDLLRAAEEAAEWLGSDQNHFWSCFGPTNVLLHRAAAAVELGNARYTVETRDRVLGTGFAALVPERRVHYLLDLARGWAQVGDLQRAGETLVAGERMAPTELRSRPVTREILGDVLRRSHGDLPPAVSEMAAGLGVGG